MKSRVLVAGVLLLSWAPAAHGQDAREQELEALRLAIEQRKQRIETFEREQNGLLDALEAIDQAVAAALEIAAHREREADEAGATARDLEAQLPDLEAQLERTRRAMSMRVVRIPVQRPTGRPPPEGASTPLCEAGKGLQSADSLVSARLRTYALHTSRLRT